MSTTGTIATIVSALFKQELGRDFAERLIAKFDEGKSLRDATWAANRVSQRPKMLSGGGVFEVWPQTGRIDGAIDTEVGPISFEGAKIRGSEHVDIQSGPVAQWEAALAQVNHAIEVASVSQEPSRAVATLSGIWSGLESTISLLSVTGQQAWKKVDPSDQAAVLELLPAAFKSQLALYVTVSAAERCEQSPGRTQIDHPWLEEAMKLEATGRSEESLDIIFDKLDDWLLGGSFDACSSFLADAPVDQLLTAQLLTILTATLPAYVKLPARAAFFDRVREVLRQRGEDADTLLSGLES